MSQCIELVDIGISSLQESISLQQSYAVSVKKSLGRKGYLLLCEHPPTLSLGKRTNRHDIGDEQKWHLRGVDIVSVDRGGGPTYHSQGQLMIYPVIKLSTFGLGLRSYVDLFLKIISNCLIEVGVKAVHSLEHAGVWCGDLEKGSEILSLSKIAFAGLRIRNGISQHGFSVNICCDLEPFSLFAPCGHKGLKVTSLCNEVGLLPDAVNLYKTSLAKSVITEEALLP